MQSYYHFVINWSEEDQCYVGRGGIMPARFGCNMGSASLVNHPLAIGVHTIFELCNLVRGKIQSDALAWVAWLK
jgi:hypothetical protein